MQVYTIFFLYQVISDFGYTATRILVLQFNTLLSSYLLLCCYLVLFFFLSLQSGSTKGAQKFVNDADIKKLFLQYAVEDPELGESS